MGTSLTHLTIDYYGFLKWGPPDQLCNILDACPNLVALSVSRAAFDPSFVSSEHPKLMKLDLINPRKPVYKNISAVLQPFPQLRLLSIIPPPHCPILPTINRCCPVLQQLFMANHPPCCLPDVGDIHEITGLRVLTLKNPGSKRRLNGDALEEYLMKHCDSIGSFEIGSAL